MIFESMADLGAALSAHGYRLLETLTQNPEGGRITHLAADASGRRVVIKRFAFATVDASWTGYRDHEREIVVLRELDHPRIPKYIDSFETDDGFCLVQQWLDVRPVGARTSFSPEQVKAMALSVLDILVYLQSRLPPVIHRDLKPDNILVEDDGTAYLVDFGLARSGRNTASTIAVGTPGFMAPEQMLGRQLTPATDLFGLGATLISMLTGTPAVELGALIDATMRFDLSTLPTGLDPRFVDWLAKLVAPTLDARHSDARVASEALESIEIRSRDGSSDDGAPDVEPRILPATSADLLPVAEPPVSPPPRLHKPEPTPPAAPETPAKPGFLVAGVLVMVAVGVLGGAVYMFANSGLRNVAGTSPEIDTRPLLTDLDGDGDEDIIYQTWRGDLMIAHSIPDHKKLWTIELDDGEGRVRLAEGTVLWSGENQVRAFEPASGTQRWQLELSDDVNSMACDAERLWIACSDKTHHLVSLHDGSVSSGPEQTPQGMQECQDAYGATWKGGAEFDWPGLRVERATCPKADRSDTLDQKNGQCRAPTGVAWAEKAPGTSIPYLVGFDRSSGEIRWQVPLLGEGSREMVFEWRIEAFDRQHVYVAYQRSGIGPAYVRAVASEDGRTLWETKVSRGERPEHLLVTDQHVYVCVGTSVCDLQAYDRATGKRVKL